ncbi:MAG TPA: hypothetical protein VH352_20980 [Pseudonocardiaceae bacterium]|nr:hypothetical protein [Pseudonocardiaceae bacterium]
MYIDDGTAGELRADVNGHEYAEQENYSYADDGVVDSVSVDGGDGGHIVYTDTDHDGTADLVTEYDGHGDEMRQAHYDAATGQWIDLSADAHQAAAVAPDTITVDTANGPHDIGPATVDTNNDGRPDTAVVHDANGDTILYTDSHGDGQADVATELTPDGQVVIADHTGPHEWTEVQRGHLDATGGYQLDTESGAEFTPAVGPEPAQDTPDDQHWSGGARHQSDESGWAAAFSDSGSAQGVVRIDATTGQWISRN